MNKIILDMFEAGNGDSFLVKCIGSENTNILIDFGYSNTYKKHIEKNLKKMKDDGEHLDLVVITHIDQDHISGGIRFFEDNGPLQSPQIIPVKNVWHNSYRHLDMVETTKQLEENERDYIEKNSMVFEQNRDSQPIDTSAKQGSRLAANLHRYQYAWNMDFSGGPVAFSTKAIAIGGEVKITVLSPTSKELDALKVLWTKELKEKFPEIALNDDKVFDDAVECISLTRTPRGIANLTRETSDTTNIVDLADVPFQEDTDEINASSITFILEFYDKKVLFLGDVKPSVVESQLKALYKEEDFPIYFNAIKVSHHGSDRNTSKSLLQIIDAPHYFISTNGNIHGHPDIEVIAKIISRETNGFIRNIYFTNDLPKLALFKDEELQKKFGFKTYYRDQKQDSIQIKL
ncbi:MBL fold metallo-hydrolase [Lysinibacillus sphaericus]|uniref:MBL fold metallo-hydrolase n=1 Tax=Lysinibacillus sphaericus TaxID=1421 RepID=UPI001E31571E|nr:MBL fold metallo-hydrolase [Lysinibacillus sphaericus]UDK97562.1 MBL fold metallo-hydrolase [Lysinibacillus sphaericus]